MKSHPHTINTLLSNMMNNSNSPNKKNHKKMIRGSLFVLLVSLIIFSSFVLVIATTTTNDDIHIGGSINGGDGGYEKTSPLINNARSFVNDLKGLFKKTKGFLKLPPTKHNLSIDFKVFTRSKRFLVPLSQQDRNDPLYRGRALLNYQTSHSNRLRVVSTSSIMQKTIYYDSDKMSYTDHDLSGERDDVIVPSSSIPFHMFFQALNDEMLSHITQSHYIPHGVPIYDEAVDRLCPSLRTSRHLVYFGEQYYVFCLANKDTVSHKNEDETFNSNLLHVKHIIGQEFIVEFENVHSSPIPIEWNNKVRSAASVNDFNMFTSSPTIQEELNKLPANKRGQNNMLQDFFPKERAIFEERGSGYFKAQSPDNAHFFSSLSCKIPYVRGKLCQETDSIVPKEERKICYFLHGAGQWPSDKGEPTTSDYTDYWGPLSDYTPQCSERWYIREETKSRGWDNIELQKNFCDFLLLKHLPEHANRNDTTVKNAIIYAHSMGNLILAAAVKNGICGLEKETVSWYNIMGPMKGSKAAHMLEALCENKISVVTTGIAKTIAAKGGYCLSKESDALYPAYESLKIDYPGISELGDIASPYIKGEMCGTSATGLNTYFAAALSFLSNLVNYGEPNDGMVTVNSCKLTDITNFSSDYYSQNYLVEANHVDGTCKSGDAWFGSVKPCSYYILKK